MTTTQTTQTQELYATLQEVSSFLYTLASEAGDIPLWNEYGEGYAIAHRVRAVLTAATKGD